MDFKDDGRSVPDYMAKVKKQAKRLLQLAKTNTSTTEPDIIGTIFIA